MRSAAGRVLASALLAALMSAPASAGGPMGMGGSEYAPHGGGGYAPHGGGYAPHGGGGFHPRDIPGVAGEILGVRPRGPRLFYEPGERRPVVFRGHCGHWARAYHTEHRRGNWKRAEQAKVAYRACLRAR
jgi:hypothetical protein